MGINRRQWLFNQIIASDPTQNVESVFNGDLEETYAGLVNSGQITADSNRGKRSLLSLPAIAPVLPATASTLPTVAVGVANAASTIASAVSIPAVANGGLNSAKFTVFGCVPTIGTVYPDDTGISSNDGMVNVSSTFDAPCWAVEFYTDALVFEINVKDNSIIRILADGAYIYGNDSTYGWKGASAGNDYLHKFTYTGGRVLRRITVEMDGPGRFYGVNVGPNDTVLPGQNNHRTMVVFGDSFTEPTIQDSGFTSTMSQCGFAWRLGQLLGIRNVITSGSGGAGYLQTGPSNRPAFTGRAQNDIGKFKPDICVMHTGINDNTNIQNGTWTQAQLQAAIESVMTQTWAVSPDTFFFLSLNWNSGNVPNAKLTAAQQAAAANHVGKCLYLPSVSGNAPYSGTGHMGAITGSGNCDVLVGTDGTHPTFYGHIWLAYQLFAAITNSLPTIRALP